MTASSLTFLTPIAGLVALVVVLPLAALVVVARRQRRVRRSLGLSDERRTVRVREVASLVALFALLALAATQPVFTQGTSIMARTDVEAYVLFDVSRSMLASEAPDRPTRFDRAIDFALKLRPGFEGVRVGVASITNRPLPHAFPTADGTTFAAVVTSAIGIEKPPPVTTLRARVTTFAALEGLAVENFFSAGSSKRAVIILTDGESRPFDPQPLFEELAAEAIELYFVRFWHQEERVWLPDGAPERYRPDPSSEALLASLSSRPRVRAFEESDMPGLTVAVEQFLGEGPIVETAVGRRTTPLAPWLALFGAIPLAFLLVRRPR